MLEILFFLLDVLLKHKKMKYTFTLRTKILYQPCTAAQQYLDNKSPQHPGQH